MELGFLGAGFMSAPMIENLLTDGHSVRVWNRTGVKARALVEAGAIAVPDPADVASPAGVVISCLADDTALDAVFDDGRVLAALGQDGLHVSMSTVSATCTERLSAMHTGQGCTYVAAPILGRPDAVKARMQSYLLAGAADGCDRIRPVLERLGAKIFEFGVEPTAAAVAKINFNFLIAAAVEAMSEAFAVVEKSGVDPRAFHQMVIGSAFGCRIYDGYGSFILEQAWDAPLFKLALGLKDVRLANETATDCDATMRLGQLLEKRFAESVDHGLGDKDWTAIAAEVREEAGL